MKKRAEAKDEPQARRRRLDQLVRLHKLDRRKKYAEWMGALCTVEHTTIDCPGCTEYGDYGEQHGPFGCCECGWTGKRRIEFPDPVTGTDGEYIAVANPDVSGSRTASQKGIES